MLQPMPEGALQQLWSLGLSGTSSPLGDKAPVGALVPKLEAGKTSLSSNTNAKKAVLPPAPGTAPEMLLQPDTELELGQDGDRSRTCLGTPVPSWSLASSRVNTGCNQGSSSYTRVTSSLSTTSGSSPDREAALSLAPGIEPAHGSDIPRLHPALASPSM